MPIADPEKRRIYARQRYARNPAPAVEQAIRYYLKNTDKIRESRRRWAKNNPDKAREANRRCYQNSKSSRLQRAYGISLDQYDALLVKQDGKCAVCSVEFGQSPNEPHVDHCHSTGKVRGILCGRCNRGLGHFKDDQTMLLRALKYLECN